MTLLRLTFLGTSAAQPTLHRNLSGLAVKANTDLLLFDCGEGSQRQMVRYGTGFTVDAVFFTHFHADHYLGIIGFLRTLGMMGREHPMHLYGPPTARRVLHQAVHLGVEALSFPVEIHELKDGDSVRREGYSVRAVGVDHRINALAYVLAEDDRPGRFHVEKAKALGVPSGPDFGKLQRGEPVTLAERHHGAARGGAGSGAQRAPPGHLRGHAAVRLADAGGEGRGPAHPRVHLQRRRAGAGPGDAALHGPRGGAGGARGGRPAPHPHAPVQPARHRPLEAARAGARGVPGAGGGGP